MKKKIPFVQALTWIVLSTFLITGSGYKGLKSYLKWKKKQAIHPDCQITAILQTGPQKEALKTIYLAELLDLSRDRPQPLYYFNCGEARKKLLRSPVIREVLVKKEPPNRLYIDYAVRQPIAWLYDFSNIAIDQEAVPFPVTPFFTPKNLPEIYLGLSPAQVPAYWHTPIQGKEVQLALEILSLLSAPSYQEIFHIRRIDTSKAYADSYGKREVVLMLEDEIVRQDQGKEVVVVFPRYLRLSTKQYAQELGNYIKLREELLSQEAQLLKIPPNSSEILKMDPKVIDLRIPHLGYIKIAAEKKEEPPQKEAEKASQPREKKNSKREEKKRSAQR